MVMMILNCISALFVLIGGINWGLVGIFNFNVVSAIFGTGQTIGSIIVYCLVLLSTIWLVISAILGKGQIGFVEHDVTQNMN